MKIHFIIALLDSLFIVGFLFYKILKANNLLPLSFQEFKKRWYIEGETIYTWTYTPPLWQRISCFLTVIIFWTTMIILWHYKENRLWYYLCFIITMILMVGMSQLRPRRYRLTDKGIWCRHIWFFSNPQKSTLTSTSTSTGKEERLIHWEEISTVKIKKINSLLTVELINHQLKNSWHCRHGWQALSVESKYVSTRKIRGYSQ